MFRKPILLLSCTAALAGCAVSTVHLAPPGQRIATQVGDLPVPAGINIASDIRPYRLGPKDVISIQVYGEPDLSLPSVTIGGGGAVDMPLLGPVMAQGLTTEGLARKLEAQFTSILVKPNVSINVVSPLSQTALIDGAVGKPGLYPIVGKTTLQELVVEAGGLQDYAILERFLVIRTVNGRAFAAIYNLKAIRDAGRVDPEILPGDKVAVGDSTIHKFIRDFWQYSTVPLILLRPKV